MINQDKALEYLNLLVPEWKASVERNNDLIIIRSINTFAIDVREHEQPDILRASLLKEIHRQIGNLIVMAQKLEKPIT